MLLTLVACSAPAGGVSSDWPGETGPPKAPRQQLRQLKNDGFTIGYETRRHYASWVAYRVTPLARFRHLSRPPFEPDPRLQTSADTDIYAGSRYDRGHLAPNYAISQLYGEHAQSQTFYYSNIAPQTPRLNQLVWQRLEEIEVDEIAPRVGRLWVFVGPVFAAGRIAPVAFFRVWLARDESNHWRVLAFRVPQHVRGDERLDRFIVSVDAIEQETGLDFLAGLAPDVQRSLEKRRSSAATFGFSEFACDPARYGRRWQGRDGIRLRYDRCADPVDQPGTTVSNRGQE